MSWNTEEMKLLGSYRHAHKMDTPPAFHSALNRALLTIPGIGRQSPTMARKRRDRKVAKDQLALAVRKNFNDAAVNEVQVAVDMLYKIRHQGKLLRRTTIVRTRLTSSDKSFRMRSNPTKTKANP